MRPEDPLPLDPFQHLKERISRFKRRYQAPTDRVDRASSPVLRVGRASRLGIELMSGVLVGVGLGVLLDRWWGSFPWGLMGGFLLGSCAGYWNIRRFLSSLSPSKKE
jgi:ATP synthase protein I